MFISNVPSFISNVPRFISNLPRLVSNVPCVAMSANFEVKGTGSSNRQLTTLTFFLVVLAYASLLKLEFPDSIKVSNNGKIRQNIPSFN